MLFPVDHGNSSIKTVNFVFSSGLADYPIRPPVDTDISGIWRRRYWTLSGKRISYMRDKTKDDRYFILTLFAHCEGTAEERYYGAQWWKRIWP